MRFQLPIIVLCAIAAGCNADPRCRRETALLRAEILDVEDKYYLIKSQRDQAISELIADGKTEIANEIVPPETIVELAPGNVIYDGAIDGGVIDQQRVYGENGVIYDGEVFYDSSVETAQPLEHRLNEDAPDDYSPTRSQPIDSFEPIDTSDLPLQSPVDTRDLESITPREPLGQIRPSNIPRGRNSLNPSRSTRSRNAPESKSPRPDAAPANSIVSTGSQKSDLVQIVVHRGETRGYDVNGQPGADGIHVLLQPKSANGRTLLETGELTVSVIDPEAPSANQRIGLWKFLPAETALFFTEGPESRSGILLQLPWEGITPRGSQVTVLVRFQTQDGRRLETSATIRIEPTIDEIPTRETTQDREPLIASGDSNRPAEDPATVTPSRRATSATPASSGRSRISKPAWRPVR